MNPLLGFRAWRYHRDDSLRSTMFWRHAWRVGASTTARCLRHATPLLGVGVTSDATAHPAPGRGCSCGVYARTTPEGVRRVTWETQIARPPTTCSGWKRGPGEVSPAWVA